MSIGTRITNLSGERQVNGTTGTQLENDVLNKGFAPFPVYALLTLTASTTITAAHCGVNAINGAGGLSMIMPTAASCPGAMFTFRNVSGHAHVLTGSAETNGTRVFHDGVSNTRGSKITLSSSVGPSVTILSDGLQFIVIGSSSGSTSAFAISGT